MRAELAKLRVLPTPRNVLFVAAGLGVLSAVGLIIDAPSDADSYADTALTGAAAVSGIGAMVLGVWMVGLEYAQGTMRRVVAAAPARLAILRDKLVVLLAFVVLGTTAIVALDWVLGTLAGLANGASVPAGDVPGELGAAIVTNLGYAVLGFAIALLTRSMAGGLTATLVLSLVVDNALAAIPTVGDYMFGTNLLDVADAIRGDQVELWGRAIAVALAWLAALSAASWLWFARQDIR